MVWLTSLPVTLPLALQSRRYYLSFSVQVEREQSSLPEVTELMRGGDGICTLESP